MLKPIIAIDIDEVLSPFVSGLVTWHNREFGTSYQFKDFMSYEFHKVWGGDLDSAIHKSSFHFENRDEVAPLEDAVKVLTQLKKGYELIVVTSRMLKHRSQTESWLEQHFPGIFSKIVLCNHWDRSENPGPFLKKSTACLQYGAQYLIDDAPAYIEEAAVAGIQGLLFGEYPWNQQIQAHPLIQRVNHWQAVLHYFNQP
jgi:hypothetical protein